MKRRQSKALSHADDIVHMFELGKSVTQIATHYHCSAQIVRQIVLVKYPYDEYRRIVKRNTGAGSPTRKTQSQPGECSTKATREQRTGSLHRWLNPRYPNWMDLERTQKSETKDLRTIIADAIRTQGLTIPQVAFMIDMNKSTLYNYLKGRSEMTSSNLAKLFEVLDLTVSQSPV